MPQLQVLQRTTDPAAAMLDQAGTDVANIILKRKQQKQEMAQKLQALRLQRQKIKINMKNAETEEEKLRLNSLDQGLGYIDTAVEKGYDPALYLKGASDTFGDQVAPILEEVAKAAKNIDHLKRLETEEAAKTRGKYTGMMEGVRGAMQGGGGQGMSMSQEPQLGKRPSIASGEQQGGNDLLFEGMTGGSPSFTNIRATEERIRRETIARESAKMQIEIAPIKAGLRGYEHQYDRAVKEMGGSRPKTALGAWMKGAAASLWARIGESPEVMAFEKLRKPLSLQLASLINRGRPTEPDREAAVELLESIYYPERVNQALRTFRNGMIDAYGDNAPLGYLAEAKSTILDTAKEMVGAWQEAGISEETINLLLDEYYKEQGY